MLAVYGSEIVASAGLLMDIGGIWLLFTYGAIGGKWIGEPIGFRFDPKLAGPELMDRVRERDENERVARRGSRCGLTLAVGGFILQIVAQWL